MKRFLVLLLLFTTISAASYAQADTTKSKIKAHKQTSGVNKQASKTKKLNLTKDQQDRIKTANKNYKDKSAKIKGDSTLTEAQKKQKLKTLGKEKKKTMDTVLTAEQKKQLQEMKATKKPGSPQKSKTSPKTK